ncbi:hypothetical protein SUBVAR_07359 [Subdoligranulum variabile DSM 15176]|uniref:Uncharacterized protein n=1 Tax=Subdoligranulum variabile DSM 15176 TaxID=411471 RepID=D1PSH6_9FIRM|nr:hypothetical protein SUBVAR_07359 [Subdoligranulum variabile DSM 15176]
MKKKRKSIEFLAQPVYYKSIEGLETLPIQNRSSVFPNHDTFLFYSRRKIP